MLVDDDLHGVVERPLRADAAVLDRGKDPAHQGSERARVLARRRRIQIRQLQKRLQILGRCTSRKTLGKFRERRVDPDHLSREHFLELDSVELTRTAVGHHLSRHGRGHEIGVGREGCPPGTVGGKENLVVLEIGRF